MQLIDQLSEINHRLIIISLILTARDNCAAGSSLFPGFDGLMSCTRHGIEIKGNILSKFGISLDFILELFEVTLALSDGLSALVADFVDDVEGLEVPHTLATTSNLILVVLVDEDDVGKRVELVRVGFDVVAVGVEGGDVVASDKVALPQDTAEVRRDCPLAIAADLVFKADGDVGEAELAVDDVLALDVEHVEGDHALDVGVGGEGVLPIQGTLDLLSAQRERVDEDDGGEDLVDENEWAESAEAGVEGLGKAD